MLCLRRGMSPLEAEIKLPVEVQKMIAQSQDPQAVQVIVSDVIQLAEQAEIHFTAVQLQVLTNHLIEMINRSNVCGSLEKVAGFSRSSGSAHRSFGGCGEVCVIDSL